MKKIYTKLIETTNPIVLQAKLIDIVEKINDSDYAERIMDILFDADMKEDDIPYKTKRYDEIRTRKSFDYLNDRVDYDYERTDIRYFVNAEDALYYSKSGDYNYDNSKITQGDKYPYEAKYVVHSNSYCTLYEWMHSEVIEK